MGQCFAVVVVLSPVETQHMTKTQYIPRYSKYSIDQEENKAPVV